MFIPIVTSTSDNVKPFLNDILLITNSFEMEHVMLHFNFNNMAK